MKNLIWPSNVTNKLEIDGVVASFLVEKGEGKRGKWRYEGELSADTKGIVDGELRGNQQDYCCYCIRFLPAFLTNISLNVLTCGHNVSLHATEKMASRR